MCMCIQKFRISFKKCDHKNVSTFLHCFTSVREVQKVFWLIFIFSWKNIKKRKQRSCNVVNSQVTRCIWCYLLLPGNNLYFEPKSYCNCLYRTFICSIILKWSSFEGLFSYQVSRRQRDDKEVWSDSEWSVLQNRYDDLQTKKAKQIMTKWFFSIVCHFIQKYRWIRVLGNQNNTKGIWKI